MGTSAGPSLQGIGRGGDSNLVLEMDAHDAKSYPGEPTTNIFSNPNNWTGSDWNMTSGGTIANNATEGPNGGSAGSITATNADPYIYSSAVHSVATGSLTFSCWVKGVGSSVGKSGDMRINFGTGTATGSDPTYVNYTLTDQWQRVSILATVTGAGTIQVGLEPPNSAAVGDVVYLADAQLEQKGYATPFVREGKGGTGTYNARPASVNLMIHGDVGSGQTFSDSSPSKHTITTVGNTTHSTTKSKFSGGSIYFDGTGDKLSVADHADWHFGSGDFTVDMWINGSTFTHSSYPALFSQYIDDNNFLTLYFGTSGTRMYLWGRNAGSAYSTLEGQVTWSTDTWYHVAVVRNGTTSYLFRDGILIDSVTESWTVSDLASPFYVGWWGYGGGDYSFKGYIDEFRVTKGTALWTAAFTPPTRRNLSAPVVDRSGNHNGINLINGTDSGGETYRVGEVIRPIDTAVLDFDGTDDYAIAGDSDDWNFGTEPFAIEQWLRFTDFTPSGDGWVTTLQQYAAEADRNGWLLFYNNGADFEWRLECTAPATDFLPTHIVTDISLNTWHLFTISREGSTFKMYIDGVLRGTDTSNPTFTNIAGPMYVGNYAAGDAHEFQGQMGALRIYKGGALTDQQVKENFNQQSSRFNVPNWSNRDIVQSGLEMWLDAGISESYPGSGTTWSDISGNGYNGTITGATYSAAGHGSLDFNGTTDKVDVSTSTWGAGSFCISMWFKGALPVNYQMLFGGSGYSGGSGIGHYLYSTAISTWIAHGSGAANLYYGSTLSADTWYNLVFQRDYGVAFNWYLNGQNIHNYSSNYLTTDLSSPNSTIAKHYNDTNYNFDGNIATTDIYTRALSASEIEQNFTVQRQRFGV